MNVNVGVPNPAYVTHPSIAAQRRIKIAGVSDSDCVLAVAIFQLQNGQVGMAVDGVEFGFEELIRVHQLLTTVTAEVDRRLQLHAQTIPGDR